MIADWSPGGAQPAVLIATDGVIGAVVEVVVEQSEMDPGSIAHGYSGGLDSGTQASRIAWTNLTAFSTSVSAWGRLTWVP